MLTLRPPQLSDADALVAACQDPEIPRWTNVPSPYTHEHALDVHHRRATRGRRTFLGFEDGVLVGSFSLLEIDVDAALRRDRLLGGEGGARSWRRDARGRVACATIGAELGLTRLELIVHKDNAALAGVARRSGLPRDRRDAASAPRVDPPTPPDYVVYAWSAA